MKFHLENIDTLKQTKHIFLLLITLLMSGIIVAQSDIPNRPKPPRLVNDFTNTLNRNEIGSLERTLLSFNNSSSNQITVVLIPTLSGYDVVEYTERLGEKWGVGRKGLDNGIVLLIKPKTLQSKGEIHIAIGYGLEAAIPDAITKRIIENEMIPYLKQNDYYSAISKSTNVLMSLAAGEFNSNEYMNKTRRNTGFGLFVPFFAILFFVLMSRASRRSSTYGGRSGGSSLLAMFFLGSMMGGGGRHGGSWSDFSGGSGGFGGFGGGSFGGGGASGSW